MGSTSVTSATEKAQDSVNSLGVAFCLCTEGDYPHGWKSICKPCGIWLQCYTTNKQKLGKWKQKQRSVCQGSSCKQDNDGSQNISNVIPSLSRLLRDKRSDRLEAKLCFLPQQNCRCKVSSSYWEGSWESTFVFLVFCSDWETKEKLPFAQNWEAGEQTAAVKVSPSSCSKVKYQCVSCPITAASSTEGQSPPLLQLLWQRLLGQSSSWPHRALVRSSWWENTRVTQVSLCSLSKPDTLAPHQECKAVKITLPLFLLAGLGTESRIILHAPPKLP